MEKNTELSTILETALARTTQEHLSFYPAQFIYTALPYRAVNTNRYERTNGSFRIIVTPGAFINEEGKTEVVLPYGKLARANLLYLTTHAKKTGSTRVELATSYRGFLRDLGISWDKKTAREAVRQLRAVLTMQVTCAHVDVDDNGEEKVTKQLSFMLGRGQKVKFSADNVIDERESYFLLSDDFLSEVVAGHAVPIVTGAWRELLNETKSPMALDIYLWLSSRLPVIRGEKHISWEQLQAQFGSQAGDLRDFKKRFRPALAQALEMYPGANVHEVGANARGTSKGFKGLLIRHSVPPKEPDKLTSPPPKPSQASANGGVGEHGEG